MAFVKPPGIQYVISKDGYCLYPDGMLGIAEDGHPRLISFDAFNPCHLTEHFLKTKLSSDEVARNAQAYAQQMARRLCNAKEYCDYHYDERGDPLSEDALAAYSANELAIHGTLQRLLSEEMGNISAIKTRAALIDKFCKHYAERSGLDIELTQQMLRQEWESPLDRKQEQLAGFFEDAFKSSARALEGRIANIASRARNSFLNAASKPELKKQGRQQDERMKSIQRNIALLPTALRTIAEHNGLELAIADELWAEADGKKISLAGKVEYMGNRISLADTSYKVALEEFIHYCDDMIGSVDLALHKNAHLRYTKSPEFMAAFQDEKEAYKNLHRELHQECHTEPLRRAGNAQKKGEKGMVCRIFFPNYDPDIYSASRQAPEHLVNMWQLVEDFRQPHSMLRTVFKKENTSADEENFFKEHNLEKSYRLSLRFMEECKREAARLEKGGKPVNARVQCRALS